MPQPYLKPKIEININRQVVGSFRDDNFNVGWTAGPGVTATTDGDIVAISGTTVANGITKSGLSVNTTVFPYLVLRVRSGAASPGTVLVSTSNSDFSGNTFTPALTSQFQVIVLRMPAGKTLNSIQLSGTSPTY